MNIVVGIICLVVINIDAGVAQKYDGHHGHLGHGIAPTPEVPHGHGIVYQVAGGGVDNAGESPETAGDIEDLTDANFNQENFIGQVCHNSGIRYWWCPAYTVCAQATKASRCCPSNKPTPCSFNAKHGCCGKEENCCISRWGKVCCAWPTLNCCYGGCCA